MSIKCSHENNTAEEYLMTSGEAHNILLSVCVCRGETDHETKHTP